MYGSYLPSSEQKVQKVELIVRQNHSAFVTAYLLQLIPTCHSGAWSASRQYATDVAFHPRINESNNNDIATMSGPISIGSESEWSSLLAGTNVVIADCMCTGPHAYRHSLTPCSLRRLVRPLQGDCAHFRSSRQRALSPEEGYLRQGQRR